MKYIVYITTITLFLNAMVLNGQGAITTDSLTPQLPTLSEFINGALENSFLIKAKTEEYKKYNGEIKLEQQQLFDYLYFEGSANYGSYDQLLVNNLTSEQNVSSNLLTKGEQVRYYCGVSLKLSLSSITKRRSEIQISKFNKQKSSYEIEQIRTEIEQLIINEYYTLKYLQESVDTFLSIYQTLEIAFMKAEKELLDGRMDINAYALLSSTVGKAKNDYLKAKNLLYAQHQKMQQLTGIKF